MRARNVISFTLLAAGAAAAAPPPPSPLTLGAAIRYALDNQKDIEIAMSQREAARAGVTQAKSAFLPQASASYRFNWQTSAFDIGGSTRKSTSGDDTASIELTQTLLDNGQRKLRLDRSSNSLKSAEYAVEDTREAVILNVTVSWFEYLRARDLVKVAEAGLERARTTLEAQKAFVEAGSSPRKDVLQAQADFDNANVSVLSAHNNVQLAHTTLRNAMGVTSLEELQIPLDPPAEPSAEPDTRTVADYVKDAYANRPDIRRAELSLNSARKDIRLARVEAGVKVQSSLSASWQPTPGPGEEAALLATASYPLFDAGSARAAVSQARSSAEQAELNLELLRQDVAAAVESAWIAREQARRRITASKTALTAARENYAAASESHREGVGTVLDVITAQNDLISAETSSVQAIYDYYTADARLKRALGIIDEGYAGGFGL